MTFLTIQSQPNKIRGTVEIPVSKSVANRLLILNQLADRKTSMAFDEEAEDTERLRSILDDDANLVDVGNAGTVMRFLTAYYALNTLKNRVLTGTRRMCQRPVKPLVDALLALGANIKYIDNEGYPPLQISPSTNISGGLVHVDASQSSQFVSALMLCGWKLKNGVSIHLGGDIVSESYIHLTKSIMQETGLQVNYTNNLITLPHQELKSVRNTVERDWSSASYFYQLLSQQSDGQITVCGLSLNSNQGDVMISKYAEYFGVETIQIGENVVLRKNNSEIPAEFKADCSLYPDLVPALVCMCVAAEIPFEISGIKSLQYKESNRIECLSKELSRLGYSIKAGAGFIRSTQTGRIRKDQVTLKTYDDHRLAMAFGVLACKYRQIRIENPQVVIKSFPLFWEQLQTLGFTFKTIKNGF